MNRSRITVDVSLDEANVPESIEWAASASSAEDTQRAKAMMMAFWDGQEKAALRIDIWTKDMMVDEMADFYYQNLMGLADSFERATNQQELVEDMKRFAKAFYGKFKGLQQQASEGAAGR